MHRRRPLSFLRNTFFWVFGVITCAYYAAVTLNGCSQAPYMLALFSPLLLIPFSNAWLLVFTGDSVNSKRKTLSLLGTLNGVSMIVSSILLAVLSPLCVLAVIFGFMLIWVPPIPEMCAFYVCVAIGPAVTAFVLRARLSKLLSKEQRKWLPIGSCLATVLACVLTAIFPVLLTQTCEIAASERSTLPQSLLLLRAVGDDNVMLQACYGAHSNVPWFFQMAGSLLNPNLFSGAGDTDRVSEAVAREIYYRVKGQPFNVAPRSRMAFLGGGSPFGILGTENYDWDDDYYTYLEYGDHDFAGETVGGVVRGLSLAHSKINGWVDADEAIAHLTWNMDFKVDSGVGKEIRAQLLLPPHAVLTGCSLWINGVKHDSVIATRDSSRQAYTISATSGEKPLLVSTAGVGRVLVQSSTGYWGKGASLVLEITTPLIVTEANKAALPLPIFTERNFSVSTDHEVSLKSVATALAPLRLHQISQSNRKPSTSTHTLVEGTISNAELANGMGTLVFARNPSITELVATDSSDKTKDVAERFQPQKLSASTPVVIVVDGSSPMAEGMNDICDALGKAQLNDASILWASDKPMTIVSHVSTNNPAWTLALNKLRDSSCLGGQNNAEALSLAITDFAKQSNTNIVWLHAGQPVKFTGDNLLNQMKTLQHKLVLYEYQVVPGPNEVIKSLDQTTGLVQVARIATTAEDLRSLFDRLSGRQTSYDIERSYVAHGSVTAPSAKHADELSQLCVSELIFANMDNTADRKKYGILAEEHKLVTPLTSALVLDNVSNYDKYGVTKHSSSNKPASGMANNLQGLGNVGGLIPVKPEPPMSLVMTCALSIMGIWFWTTRRRRQST